MSYKKNIIFAAVNIFAKICSLLLVVVFCNVIISKSVHEFFEHDHIEHTCDVEGLTHFHEFEFTHVDVICEFNLNTDNPLDVNYSFKADLNAFDRKVSIIYLWLVKNLFIDLTLQRGPPTIS